MKKLIAMLLVLTMVLSFAACAKQDTVTPTVADVAITTAAADPTPAAETEASDPAPVVTAMSHADYVAADNETEVVVETYVQAHQSWWDNKVTVYCQSPDGAYFLYELACSEEDAAKLVPGTKIRVTGYKGEWSGEVEIMDGTFEFVEDGDTYIAEALDVTDLLGTDELIDHQNEFVSFTGLTVEYAAKRGACAILRGLRAVSDFEYEFQLALMNRRLQRDIQTVFLMTDYQWLFISSTIVKAAASHGADIVGLVPENVRLRLMEKYQRGEVRQATPCLSAPYGGFRVNK